MGLALTVSLTLAMAGCAETPLQENASQEVALLEPVGMTGAGEAAAYRNLYDAEIYSATVVPYVEEYGFDEDVVLDQIQAFPGETVRRGEALALSDTETLDKQIKEQMERIEEMETEFVEYELQVRENLADPQEEVKGLRGIVENLERRKPAEYLEITNTPEEEEPPQSVSGSDADGDEEDEPGAGKPGEAEPEEKEPQINPAYREWEQEYNYWNGRYRIADHSVNTALLQLEQRTALYELDYAYAQQQLAFLQEKKNNVTIHSGMEGHVVAMVEYADGDWIPGRPPSWRWETWSGKC